MTQNSLTKSGHNRPYRNFTKKTLGARFSENSLRAKVKIQILDVESDFSIFPRIDPTTWPLFQQTRNEKLHYFSTKSPSNATLDDSLFQNSSYFRF